MHLPGVAETFRDELDLVSALQLRWHTALAGAIERELAARPGELEEAVLAGWREAATSHEGVRAVLDSAAASATDPSVATVLERARRKDWVLLAAMAGKAGPADPRAARIGQALEGKARGGRRADTTLVA
jgi:hypothetical protein